MTPREYHGPERRQRRRREIDEDREALAESVDSVAHDAPIVRKLVHASERVTKIGGAAMLIGGLIGGGAVALGIRVVGPRDAQAQIAALAATNTARITTTNTRVDASNARIDSLVHALDDLRYTVQSLAFVQCIQVRRTDPDLTSGDCTPVQPKGAR